MAEPPVFVGAVNDTDADPSPRVAMRFAGATETVAAPKVFDAADGALVPTVFVAVTVHW